MMPPSDSEWYAAYTRSKAEKKVACELEQLGIHYYLPLVETIRQWSDRKKKIEVPLINSYIFVHITMKEYMPVVLVPGVVKIVHFSGKPVPIPDWQIENLRILVGASVPITPVSKDFEKGEEVWITHGTLKGLRGRIMYIKGQQKLVISINALEYNLTVNIDPGFVEGVDTSPPSPLS